MRDGQQTGCSFCYDDCTRCLCGATLSGSEYEVRKPYAWGAVRFVRCAQCGSMIQSPRVSTSSMLAWYNSDTYQKSSGKDQGPYIDYLSQERQRQREASARYKRDISPIIPLGARVLEVGCATGSLLAVLRDAGYDVSGVELSESFAERARDLNQLELVVGDFREFEHAGDYFDLIIMLGTISNLRELHNQLDNARRLLKPGGWLYFNMPTADSVVSRIFGERFWMYAPSVCNFMTRKGARAALARAGFEVFRDATDRQQPTVAKLIGHLRWHGLYRILDRAGLGMIQIPVALPIPGVSVVWARVK